MSREPANPRPTVTPYPRTAVTGPASLGRGRGVPLSPDAKSLTLAVIREGKPPAKIPARGVPALQKSG